MNTKYDAQRIYSFYDKCRRMPSYSEILKLLNLKSKNAAFKRVRALVNSGLIEKDKKGKILPKNIRKDTPIRFLGVVTAGFPSPAEEELRDTLNLDDYLITNPQATYILKVDGDSMLDAGIHPGDLVLVQKNVAPRHGDIVVAKVDNEWTIKYFEKRGGRVILRAANNKYPNITPKEELVIAGVVIADVRKYK